MDDRYLFKAKRIDNGEWIVGSLIQAPYLGSIRSWISSEQEDKTRLREISSNQAVWRAFEVRTDTICQCTGKRDKHNNLIFENDLMDGFIYPYLSGLDSEHDYFAEVCWCDDITGFGICTHKYKNSDVRGSADGDVDLIEDFDSSKWEVIGNIFDNKELLESEVEE